MDRLTETRKGKYVIPLRNVVRGIDMPHWSIEEHRPIQSFLSGDAADKLAAYEDTGLEAEEIKENIGLLSPICIGCDGKTADGKRTEKCTYDDDFRKCLERSVHLSELAHAEEQGLLIRLPCKVGDTVWRLAIGTRGKRRTAHPQYVIYEFRISEVYGSKSMMFFGHNIIDGKMSTSYEVFREADFGKTIFLTREEAEAVLKGGQDDV